MTTQFEMYADITQDISSWLRFYRQIGIESIALQEAFQNSPEIRQAVQKKTPLQTDILVQKPLTDDHKLNLNDIDSLNNAIISCKKCAFSNNLCHPLPGRGNLQAKLVLLLKSPDHEDLLSKTIFSGRKAELLELMLTSIGMTMSDVYLTYFIKCQQQGQQKNATNVCYNFLFNELKLINPKAIFEFGKSSAAFFLSKTLSLQSLRCKLHISSRLQEQGIHTRIIFTHPFEAMLSESNPAKLQDIKKEIWQDLRFLKEILQHPEK